VPLVEQELLSLPEHIKNSSASENSLLEKEFEDTKRTIRNRISKKNRQHASHLDLLLEIDNAGRLKTKLYDK
jgi:hypothetical protein